MKFKVNYKTFLLLPVGFLFTAMCFASAAEEIEIKNAKVRYLPKTALTTGVFCSIINKGTKVHKLVSAKSSKAKVTELHTHKNDNGMMRMSQVKSIDLAPGKTTELKPGSFHIMLIDLVSPTKKSEKVEVVLSFEDGSKKKIIAETIDIRHNMK